MNGITQEIPQARSTAFQGRRKKNRWKKKNNKTSWHSSNKRHGNNQSTDSTGRLIVSECRLKVALNRNLWLFHLTLNFLLFKQTVQTLIRRRVLWRLIWVCTVCQCPKCPSSGFTDNPLSTALWRHSDKNNAAINNHYLDFVKTRGLISLVNDNHEDNYLKEILLFVNYDWIVNNRP